MTVDKRSSKDAARKEREERLAAEREVFGKAVLMP